jgi:cysteine desulfurase
MHQIYFDNNATTQVDPQVRQAITPYLENMFGNPSSAHRFGEVAKAGIEKAREQLANFLQCHTSSIVFTGGGSEANNLAIWSAIADAPGKKHIVSSVVEHPSVLAPLRFLQKRFGYDMDLLPVDGQGGIDLKRLASLIRPDTALVSLMGANNETGVLWPIVDIGALCRERAVLFHCDAVQMAGKVDLDFAKTHVDYLSLAAHKMHGPKGVGALCVRRTAPVTPLIMGSDQEDGRRAGTENVPGIVGFGKACELAGENIPGHQKHMKELRDRIEKTICENVSDVMINGQGMPRLANTLNVSFRHCSSAALIQELDVKGIAISAHSACQSGDLDPSHVLAALGLPEEYMHGTLRISLSRFNTPAEVDAFLDILPGLVAKSRHGFAF